MPQAVAFLILALAGALTSAEVNTGSRIERKMEKFIDGAVKFVKGPGAETVVGTGIGFCAGFTCKQVQLTAVSICLAAGVTGLGAYWLGFLTDKQVEEIKSNVQAKADEAAAVLPKTLKKLDIDKDSSLTTRDGKLAMSKVKPFAKRHVGFTGGLVSGLLVGYTIL
jgi:hypothetical protein